MTQSRRRGRPSGGGGETQATILAAAREQFAVKGFAATSLRSIAQAAGVDASLISHYFGGKDQLLVATMELPINPIDKIAGVLAGQIDGMGDRLLRTFLEAWDPHREVFSTVARTSLAGGDEQAPMLMFARNILIATLTDRLDGHDRQLRASLIASQVIGMAIMRYVVRVDVLAEASIDDVVEGYAPSVQALMDG